VRILLTSLAFSFCVASCFADENTSVDKSYIKSLASPDKTVLVVDYRDGNGKTVDRQGFANSRGFSVSAPTKFSIDENNQINLAAIKPCSGSITVPADDYQGSCAGYAQAQLAVQLKNPRVIYCIANFAEKNASEKNATCWGYWFFPGTLDSVSSIEDELLSVGAVELNEKINRADFVDAMAIAKKQHVGIWAESK